MPGYETTAITRISCSEEESRSLKEKLENIIRQYDGTLLSYENWGVRRLASRHSRETKGRYHYFAYTSNEKSPKEIERNLKINENVLFYLSVRVNNGKTQEELEELRSPTVIMKSKTAERQDSRDKTKQDYKRPYTSSLAEEKEKASLTKRREEKGSKEIAANNEE